MKQTIGDHFLAAMHGNVKELEAFVKEKNLNERHITTNSTLLDMTVSRNHVEATAWLLEKGADIYLHQNHDCTLLHTAIGSFQCEKYKKEDTLKIIKLLLSHESKIRGQHPERYSDIPLLKDTKFNHHTVPLSFLSNNPNLQREVENLISRYGYQPEDAQQTETVMTGLRHRQTQKQSPSSDGVFQAPQALFSGHSAIDHAADQERTILLTRNSPTSSQPNITTCRSDASSGDNLMQKIRSFFSLT